MIKIEVLSILFVVFFLFLSMVVIKIIEKKTNINGEAKRKLFHITMGLVMLTFPYIFNSIYSVRFACDFSISDIICNKTHKT